MVELVYQTDEMRNVGMLEIVNEPVRNEGKASSMRSKYYPKAVEVRRYIFGLVSGYGLMGEYTAHPCR